MVGRESGLDLIWSELRIETRELIGRKSRPIGHSGCCVMNRCEDAGSDVSVDGWWNGICVRSQGAQGHTIRGA